MGLAWSEVVSRLVEVVETWPGREGIARVGVVRDLRGQVRLAASPRAGRTVDASGFERAIVNALGGWFAPPVLWTDAAAPEERRLAHNLLTRLAGLWPAAWPRSFDQAGVAQPIRAGGATLDATDAGTTVEWCGELRVRSKDVWLHEGHVEPPWPLLQQGAPAIVSFYSFKGGVGRTTTLGILARQLARLAEGQRVVVVDLDLEAPGLGRFFDVETERGVLDLLCEHAATGRIDTADLALCAARVDTEPGEVTVYPVGPMDATYVERLACLDYAPHAHGEPSAVEAALRAVLKAIKARHRPDYILLDTRAGLHDLGGLSLHALAHVDVLVGRAGPATRDGFELVLGALSRRRRDEDLRVVTVQTFVPLPVDGEEHSRARDAWTLELYDTFAATLYERAYAGADLPKVRSRDAWHFPWVVPAYDTLAGANRLRDIDATVLDAKPLAELRGRLIERCNRPPMPDDEVDDGREVPE
jgi:cellulose biosynthesis protein BcsQ